MQVSAIPTGPVFYQPVTAVPTVAPVKSQPADAADAAAKSRPAPPDGVGNLLDIEV